MSKKNNRILVSGSATIDMFADVESSSIKMSSDGYLTDLICFTSGSKVQIKDLKIGIGGGGVNTAIDLKRLKNKPTFLGKIGSGNNGSRILKALKTEGVGIIKTRPSKIETGFSIIIKSRDGDRTILAYKGANNELKQSDYNKKNIKDFDWFYFASMVGTSYDTLKKLAEYAVENDKKIIFNPSSYVVKKGITHIKKIAKASDIFIVNMSEAQITLKTTTNYAQLPENEVDNILKKLYSINKSIVIVTNGPLKAYAYDGRIKYSALPYPAKIIDNAGAGDAFSSGFLSGYIKEEDIEYAFRSALSCANSAVSNTGTWLNLKSMKEVERLSEKNIRKKYSIAKKRLI